MMDFAAVVSDACRFSRDTFLTSRTRWPALILLCLPVEFLYFIPGNNPAREIISGSSSFWDIGWPLAAILFFGLLPMVFIFGYLAHIYRGIDSPPGFGNPPGLLRDGFMIWLVSLIWSLPADICLFVTLALFYGSGLGGNSGAASMALVIATLGAACITALLYACSILFHVPGVVRYSRTGDILEGLNFREILATIRKIGWRNYLLMFLLLVVAAGVAALIGGLAVVTGAFVAFLVTSRVEAITVVASAFFMVFFAIVTPVVFVFSARVVMRVYESGFHGLG